MVIASQLFREIMACFPTGVAIVTPELSRACAIAASAGAAAKPSGAGGGDCAIVLAFDDGVLERAARDLQAAGFSPLRIAPALP